MQQPLAHDAAVQVHVPPAPQVCPDPHPTQAAPPMPHVALAEVWHWPFASQQPEGQDVASQTHLPCVLHSCLVAQLAHVPPPRPHAVFDGVVLHTPLAQQPLQDVPPQLHAPPLQAWPPAHDPHAFPANPHALLVWLAVRTQFAP